jgi:hypothetical protein
MTRRILAAATALVTVAALAVVACSNSSTPATSGTPDGGINENDSSTFPVPDANLVLDSSTGTDSSATGTDSGADSGADTGATTDSGTDAGEPADSGADAEG